MAQQGTQSTRKVAYSMTERDGKTYWNKIGIAFVNRDGSITVNLEAFPVSGRLQLRDEEERSGERRGSEDRRSGDDRGGGYGGDRRHDDRG
jgi:hypothetical protein